MSEWIKVLFGEGRDLNPLQMGMRALIVSIYALILMRVAGRRSFQMRAPFDNMIIILLGAILGRAVLGASPFIPTLTAGLVICILHRLIGLLAIEYEWIGTLIKGKKILIYQKGDFIDKNMKRCLISKGDVRARLRLMNQNESFDQIDKIFMERDGNITVLKKEI